MHAAAAHARVQGAGARSVVTADAEGAPGCGGFLAGGVSPLCDGEGTTTGVRSG